MLIVLDNFEQLIASVGMLEELIRLAPGVTLLVTSREKLRARGEQLFMLDGLDSDTGRTEQLCRADTGRTVICAISTSHSP
ncbi:MAG: hypothetical protein M9965_20330 [Anaerolineae bacterium]|nr:hypothetical protein [Anaerolineae bacterium]